MIDKLKQSGADLELTDKRGEAFAHWFYTTVEMWNFCFGKSLLMYFGDEGFKDFDFKFEQKKIF